MQSTPSVPSFPDLSPSEFRIFAVLALHGPLTIREIGQALARQDPHFNQGYNALGTLLQRMVKKGYVTQDEPLRTAGKLYRPLLPYDLVVRRQIENFFDTLFLTSQEDLQVVVEVAQARMASQP